MARAPAASVALIGAARAGKTTLFSILTGIDYTRAARESAGGPHAAHVPVRDDRVARLAELAGSKKISLPIMEFVDTPPLKLEGGADAELLGRLREVDAYAVVIPAYADPAATDEAVRSALFMSDIEVMQRAIKKLEKKVKRPTPTREEDRRELEALRTLIEETADGRVRALKPEDERKLRGFQFFSCKPIVPIRNLGETALAEGGICLKLEQDLLDLEGAEREEFEQMYGIKEPAAPRIVHEVCAALDLLTFYTANVNEAAAWQIRRGTPVVEAAAAVHTDLGRTFICAEVTPFDDYVKKVHPHTEGKDYVVQDRDVVLIRAGDRKR